MGIVVYGTLGNALFDNWNILFDNVVKNWIVLKYRKDQQVQYQNGIVMTVKHMWFGFIQYSYIRMEEHDMFISNLINI